MLSTIQVSPGELLFRCDHIGLLLSKLELCINTASLSTIVGANQVFEFSDYLWALLISSSKVSSSFYGRIATSFSLILLINFTHNPISTRHLQLHNLYPTYIYHTLAVRVTTHNVMTQLDMHLMSRWH